MRTKYSKATSLILSSFCLMVSTMGTAYSTDSKDAGYSSFLIALKAQAPIHAHYVNEYKKTLETHCKKEISIDELGERPFFGVVNALVIGHTMGASNEVAPGLLTNALNVVSMTLNCNDFGAPLKYILSNKRMLEAYPDYVDFLIKYESVADDMNF